MPLRLPVYGVPTSINVALRRSTLCILNPVATLLPVIESPLGICSSTELHDGDFTMAIVSIFLFNKQGHSDEGQEGLPWYNGRNYKGSFCGVLITNRMKYLTLRIACR